MRKKKVDIRYILIVFGVCGFILCISLLLYTPILFSSHSSVLSSSTMTPHAVNPVFYGVNVDMSQLLPGSQNYLINNKGEDLIDIAHHLGINLFRITGVTRSFDTVNTQLYTKEQWDTVLNKMAANDIKALILIETPSNTLQLSGDTLTTDYLTLVKNYIITPDVLSNPDVYGIDLTNEPVLTPENISTLQRARDMIKSANPTIPICIGGWRTKTGIDVQGKTEYNWNNPPDGSLLNGLVDFYCVHIYGYDVQNATGYPDPYSLTNSFITTVKTYSGNKPILIEEFGSANGVAFTDHETLGSEELQAYVYGGVYRAVNDLISQDVIGAVQYVFTSRNHQPEGWSILSNDGNTTYLAAYVLQKFANEKTNANVPLLSTLPPEYILTNNQNDQTIQVKKGSSIGLKLSLNANISYIVDISSNNSLVQTEPLFYNSWFNKWYMVFYAKTPGITHITISEPFHSRVYTNTIIVNE